jgi:hypothetical protein
MTFRSILRKSKYSERIFLFLSFRLGFVLGPFIGSIMNLILGYAGPYYIYAAFLFFGNLYFWMVVPKEEKKKVT